MDLARRSARSSGEVDGWGETARGHRWSRRFEDHGKYRTMVIYDPARDPSTLSEGDVFDTVK